MKNKIIKFFTWNNYILSYTLICMIVVCSYLSLREIMLDQRGWFEVKTSPLTLNTLAVFFLSLYVWNYSAGKWLKVKDKSKLQMIEIAGSIWIIVVFYLFLQYQ